MEIPPKGESRLEEAIVMQDGAKERDRTRIKPVEELPKHRRNLLRNK